MEEWKVEKHTPRRSTRETFLKVSTLIWPDFEILSSNSNIWADFETVRPSQNAKIVRFSRFFCRKVSVFWFEFGTILKFWARIQTFEQISRLYVLLRIPELRDFVFGFQNGPDLIGLFTKIQKHRGNLASSGSFFELWDPKKTCQNRPPASRNRGLRPAGRPFDLQVCTNFWQSTRFACAMNQLWFRESIETSWQNASSTSSISTSSRRATKSDTPPTNRWKRQSPTTPITEEGTSPPQHRPRTSPTDEHDRTRWLTAPKRSSKRNPQNGHTGGADGDDQKPNPSREGQLIHQKPNRQLIHQFSDNFLGIPPTAGSNY